MIVGPDNVRMRSRAEVIVATQLKLLGIPYAYELPLTYGGSTIHPDFTVEDVTAGITYYWEHFGMPRNPKYVSESASRVAWYRAHRIYPYEEGGGPEGTLIVSRESGDGGISVMEIEQLARKAILKRYLVKRPPGTLPR
jgi:hypothetical protein